MSKTVSSFFRNIIQRPFNVFKPVLSPAFLITAVGMRNESDREKEGELQKEHGDGEMSEKIWQKNANAKIKPTYFFYHLEWENVRAYPFWPCATLLIVSLSSPYKRTESLLRALLTALCKLLAGGNDFTKKVTPPPPVRINEPFIHFHIYKKRTQLGPAWQPLLE